MVAQNSLRLKKLGINTYKEAVVYMRADCPVCRSEGFEVPARIAVTFNDHIIIATLETIESDLLKEDEASLSNYAWELLAVKEGDEIQLSHPKPLESVNYIRAKIGGDELSKQKMDAIVKDLVAGYLSDIQISAFLSSCAEGKLTKNEILHLTQAMIDVGNRLEWPNELVVDKHCVGGLPGNRTSIIIVPIVTAFGLMMPKTSSRAITSPAGTADTMEVLAPVNLNLAAMRRVVELERGCIVWGGAVDLSPADDMFIRIESVLDLDSEGQLVASILSKKIAAGSNCIVIDIPFGATAKVKNIQTANMLMKYLIDVGEKLGVKVRAVLSDGVQPIGRGIGPALEARDVLAVLQCSSSAPQDLRERALMLAGYILEFSPDVSPGTGKKIATQILDSGRAWQKFQAICHAQGGMFEPPIAPYTYDVCANKAGVVTAINNQYLATVAKLAGAPKSKAAGIELLSPLGTKVQVGQSLYVIHAQSAGELNYAVNYVEQGHQIIHIEEAG